MNEPKKDEPLSSLANLLGNIYLMLGARDIVYQLDKLYEHLGTVYGMQNLLIYTAEELLQDEGWYEIIEEQEYTYCQLIKAENYKLGLKQVLNRGKNKISNHDLLAIISNHEELLLELKTKTNLFLNLSESCWDMYKEYRKKALEQISAK